MTKALGFYRDTLGFSVIKEGMLSPIEIRSIIGLKETKDARVVILKNRFQDTLVELIELSPSSGFPSRKGLGSLEYGIYDIAIFVKDIQECYKEGLRLGYQFASEPIPYQPNWVPHKVWEVVMFGPDNTPVVFFQRENDEAKGYGERYIRLNHSAQIVQSIDRVKDFYGGVLGLDPKGDMKVPGGVVDRVMGYPSGTEARLAFYERKCSNTCLIEFIEAKYQARTLGMDGRPPNHGIFMLSFESDDLQRTVSSSKHAGFPLRSQPVVYQDILHGKITAVTVMAPSDIMVCIFQKGEVG
jgi:catechol 2,3-dioxygenase-like lactoylglutathione lyase family enzyme